jgi:ABC-type lipoprotein export system ATPase subunit
MEKPRLEIIKLLSKLKVEQGTTIVIVTHDSQASSMKGRMLAVSDGKLLAKENREHT